MSLPHPFAARIAHERPAAAAWTAAAPLLCLVHCLAAPVLAMVAPAVVELPALEWSFLVVSLWAVGTGLRPPLRRHGHRWMFVVAAAGLMVWAATLLGAFGGRHEELIVASASGSVAVSLLANLHRRRRLARQGGECTTCGDERCPVGDRAA